MTRGGAGPAQAPGHPPERQPAGSPRCPAGSTSPLWLRACPRGCRFSTNPREEASPPPVQYPTGSRARLRCSSRLPPPAVYPPGSPPVTVPPEEQPLPPPQLSPDWWTRQPDCEWPQPLVSWRPQTPSSASPPAGAQRRPRPLPTCLTNSPPDATMHLRPRCVPPWSPIESPPPGRGRPHCGRAAPDCLCAQQDGATCPRRARCPSGRGCVSAAQGAGPPRQPGQSPPDCPCARQDGAAPPQRARAPQFHRQPPDQPMVAPPQIEPQHPDTHSLLPCTSESTRHGLCLGRSLDLRF
mmetsp:Transcript_7600/g.14320  ORF Transcript_7600/g.14320 Transcript_7600/m.14320 type:complete len:296 (-) Transcript_7600:1610-2497(-)